MPVVINQFEALGEAPQASSGARGGEPSPIALQRVLERNLRRLEQRQARLKRN